MSIRICVGSNRESPDFRFFSCYPSFFWWHVWGLGCVVDFGYFTTNSKADTQEEDEQGK